MLRGVYPGEAPLNLHEIVAQPVGSSEEPRYQELMRQHHYLGALPKISQTVWYVARWREQWVALLSFSASALKCGARDGWIGRDLRHRYSRLKLIVNNSRFLLLPKANHGRIETRKIWTTTELNDYLNFPHVGQAFLIERHSIVKKTGKVSLDVAYGITSRSPQQATPERVLMVNRGHWTIENSCHSIIDWNYGEDRGRISTGFGPENMSRLRRFAVGLIKSKQVRSVPGKMREFTRNVRLVFDLVRMTKNSCIQPVRS
jgi:hypothetical protein